MIYPLSIDVTPGRKITYMKIDKDYILPALVSYKYIYLQELIHNYFHLNAK